MNQGTGNAIMPLLSAIYVGDADTAKALLESGVDVNARDKCGDTALMKAADCQRLEIVTMLTEKGADVNARNESGMTALILGTRGDRDDTVRVLLGRGADVNAKNNVGVTALMSAAFYGNAAAVKLLLKNGAETDAASQDRQTALMLVGDANAAKLLLKYGADVNAWRQDGRTALMEAALACDKDTVSVLLARRADANAQDTGGRTAMIWAMLAEDKRTGLELQNDLTWKLLKSRCGLYKETAVLTARRDAPLKDIVKKLLKSGADIDARDHDGWTALKLAKIRSMRVIVKLFVGAGASLSQQDVMELDFFSAVKNDDAGKVRGLLGKGADVDVRNHKGVSVFGAAAYWNHVEIARVLLAAGANVSAEDCDGQTALMYAERRGNHEIVELINEKECQNDRGTDGRN